MSNLSVVNFTCGGYLTVSGICTLSSVLNSSANMDIQGLKTSTLAVTGIATFNGSLPTSSKTPVLDNELTTKIYVDNQDATQKTYIDEKVTTINSRIDANETGISNNTTRIDTNSNDISTNTNNISTNNTNLNERIKTTDENRKTYIDEQIYANVYTTRPSFYSYKFQNAQLVNSTTNNKTIILNFNKTIYNIYDSFKVDRNFEPVGYPGYYLLEATVSVYASAFKLEIVKVSYADEFDNDSGANYIMDSKSISSATPQLLTISIIASVYLNGRAQRTDLGAITTDKARIFLISNQNEDLSINGGDTTSVIFKGRYLHP
jgi:hypothetical protein